MPLTREELLVAVEENAEEIWKAYWRFLPGAWYKRDPGIRVMSSSIPVAFMNGVAITRLTEEECDDRLPQAIGEMVETGMPWAWQVGPNCTPYDLVDRLTRLGLEFTHDTPSMAIDLKRWKPAEQPAGFQIQEVNDLEAYEKWASVAEQSFGLPSFVFDAIKLSQASLGFARDCEIRNLIGLENGVPVACGTVFYGAGIAGIYTIGTLPEERGKGYGGAITEACMSDALRRGTGTAFLQSSKMGYPVYKRLGFEEVCRFQFFTTKP